jgi:hypothetical protein
LRPRQRICPAQLPRLAPDLLPGLDIDHQQVAGEIKYRRDATLPLGDCDSHQPRLGRARAKVATCFKRQAMDDDYRQNGHALCKIRGKEGLQIARV